MHHPSIKLIPALANKTSNSYQVTILKWFVLHAAKGFFQSIATQNDKITDLIKFCKRKHITYSGKIFSRTKYSLNLLQTYKGQQTSEK